MELHPALENFLLLDPDSEGCEGETTVQERLNEIDSEIGEDLRCIR